MHRRPIQNPQQQEIFRPAMESAVTIQPDVFRHNYETEHDRKEDEEEEYDDDDESMHEAYTSFLRGSEATPRLEPTSSVLDPASSPKGNGLRPFPLGSNREEEDTPRPYVPIQHQMQHQMQMPVPLPKACGNGHEKACGNGHENGPAKSGFNIDQVTLECMMNKNLYKKYLARTDVDKYQQSQVQSRHLSSVRAPVLEMTRQLIDDYVKYGNSKQYTHKIHSAFEAYIDLCMIYVAEHPPGSEHDDVDIMFDPRKMKSSNN
jgi:hypothetical protein